MRPLPFALFLALPLAAHAVAQGKVVDHTFPAFTHGDGRQKLSEFFGQPLLVATFADGWGGTAASQAALALHKEHAADGLVVILSHQGPIRKDAPVEAPAWAMRLHPGSPVRVCEALGSTPWTWSELPHYYAVVGPDGEVLGAGNVQNGTKAMAEAVKAALQRSNKGWGDAAESAVRACYARGALAKARTKADACGLGAEVDALFERHCAAIRWLIADGQWLCAKRLAEQLASGAKGVASWEPAITALLAELADERAKRELDLDTRLERLTAPLAKKRPDDVTARRLREFAKEHDGSRAAVRALRIAELVEQSLTIR